MAGFMDSFSKGITTINVKTNNFMEENKIKTYISTLENEANGLLGQVGNIAYGQWKTDGNLDVTAMESLLQQIRGKEQEIEVQKQKIMELQKQEEQILGKKNDAAPQMNQGEVTYCSKCGAANVKGYKFCSKCGSPL